MNSKYKMLSVLWLTLGVILAALGIAQRIDSFWTGMGGGLIGVSIMQLVRQHRYKTDEEYREKTDIETKDERNRYINMKAWSYAAELFIVISAIGIIALKIMGKTELISGVSLSFGLLMLLFWLSYLYLRTKN